MHVRWMVKTKHQSWNKSSVHSSWKIRYKIWFSSYILSVWYMQHNVCTGMSMLNAKGNVSIKLLFLDYINKTKIKLIMIGCIFLRFHFENISLLYWCHHDDNIMHNFGLSSALIAFELGRSNQADAWNLSWIN